MAIDIGSRTIPWSLYEKFQFFCVPSFHGLMEVMCPRLSGGCGNRTVRRSAESSLLVLPCCHPEFSGKEAHRQVRALGGAPGHRGRGSVLVQLDHHHFCLSSAPIDLRIVSPHDPRMMHGVANRCNRLGLDIPMAQLFPLYTQNQSANSAN